MNDLPLGQQRIEALRKENFSEQDILEYRAQSEEILRNEGYDEDSIRGFFGDPKPNLDEVKTHIKEDATWHPPMVPQGQEGKYNPNARKAKSVWDAFESGLKNSSAGLAYRGELSDVELKPGASIVDQMAYTAGLALGDLPAAVAGGAGVGAGAGAAASAVATPVVGAPVGVASGLFAAGAVPAGMRKILINKYRNGEVKSAQEFSDLFTGVLAESMKEGAISLATGGAGALAGKAIGPLTNQIASKLGKQVVEQGAKLTAEAATMGVAGPAVEGRLPEPEDFSHAAIMTLGMHTAFSAATYAGKKGAQAARSAAENKTISNVKAKFEKIYEETGLQPNEVAQMAEDNPTLQRELVSRSKDVPKSLEQFKETEVKKPEITEKLPEHLGGTETTTQLEFPFAEIKSEDPAAMGKKPTGDVPEGTIKKPTKKEQEVLNAQEAVRKKFEGVTPEKLKAMSEEEANALVRGRIQSTKEQPGLFKNLDTNELVRQTLDEYDPILRLQKLMTGAKTKQEAIDAIPAAFNPYVLARTLKGVVGKTVTFTQYETFDYNTFKKTGESLSAILKPYKKSIEAGQGLENFMAAARAIELGNSGRESGFANTPEMAVATRKAYEAGKEKYGKDAKRIIDYQRRLLKYLVDSGVKSQKEYDAMIAKGEHYIPFKRVIDTDPQRLSSSLKPKDPKDKKLKGSELPIYSPIEMIVKDTHEVLAMAERNRVMKALKEMIGDNQELMRKVEVDPGKEVTANGESSVEFRPLKENEIAVFEDGERIVFEVPADVAQAVSGMDQASMGLMTKMMAKSAGWLRAGVILDPLFTAKNITRDQMHAFVMSKNGYLPVISYFDGLYSMVKKNEAFVNWMKGGGMAATIQQVDRNYISSNIQKLAKETGFLKQAGNVVKSRVNALSLITELGELPTRLGEYKKSTRGASDISSVIKGSYDARNVTLDFQKRGAKIAALNMITPFFNARIQGSAQLISALKDNTASTVMKGGMLSLASAILWAVNRDDERMKEAPKWVKDMFWQVGIDEWVPSQEGEEGNINTRQLADGSWETNVGEIHKIPKPQELGLLFGGGMEAALDALDKQDPEGAKELAATILKSFIPLDAPQAIKLPVELLTNHSFFYDGPIVDYFTEQEVSHLQYGNNTSEASKFLARKMDEAGIPQGFIPAPSKMDYFVRGSLGTLGAYGLAGVSHVIQALGGDVDKKMTAKEWNELSFVRAFGVKLPEAAKSVNDFYKINAEEIQPRIKEMKQYQNSGLEDRAAKLANKKEFMVANALKGEFKEALSAFKEIREAVAGITSIPDSDMTKDEKSRAIDALLWKRAAIARDTVLMFKHYKKEISNGAYPEEIIYGDDVEGDEQ